MHSTLHLSFDSYANPRKTDRAAERTTPVNEPMPNGERLIEPAVRVPLQACTAKSFCASRIKWKLEPSFNPLPFLPDPVVREAFVNPDVLRMPEHKWPQRPRAIVHSTKPEILKLAEKWDELGACSVIGCNMV